MAFERNLEERKKFFEQNKWKLDQALNNSVPQPKVEPTVVQSDVQDLEDEAVEETVFLVDAVDSSEETVAEEEVADVEPEEDFAIEDPDLDGITNIAEEEIEETAEEEADFNFDAEEEVIEEEEAAVEEEADFNFEVEEEAIEEEEAAEGEADFNFDAEEEADFDFDVDDEINLDDLDLED